MTPAGHDVQVNQLIARAQHEDPRPVLDALVDILADPDLTDLLRVRYTNVKAVALHYAGDTDACRETVAEAIAMARAIDATGWVVNFLAYQAEYAIDDDNYEAALDRLVEAETLVADEADLRLRAVAHTGIGQTLRYAGLYELALPHFSEAHEIDLLLGHLDDPVLVGYANLVEVNLDWAENIDRVRGTDRRLERSYRVRLDAAAGWCERALAAIHDDMPPDNLVYVPWFRRVQAQLDAIADPVAGVAALPDLLGEFEARQRSVDVVALRIALARAQRESGDPHALGTARHAQRDAAHIRDQNLRITAAHEVHRCHLAVDASAAADDAPYIDLLNRTLWERRLSDVASYRIRIDLTNARQAHEVASAEARIDPLTGLANRRAFKEWVRQHPSASTSLFVIDLDRFKTVNDTHGHGIGDALLCAVADALRDAVHPDLVVRHGGDEFIVALDRAFDAAATVATIERLQAAVGAVGVDAGGERIHARASIGAATARPGVHIDDVLAEADAAMFATKRQRRSR